MIKWLDDNLELLIALFILAVVLPLVVIILPALIHLLFILI